MELVYRTYEKHIKNGRDLQEKVSIFDQTIAAQTVGKKNLIELESTWKNGSQITKLLLGMGRVFQVLAKHEGKQSPEVNQFFFDNSSSMSDECKAILDASVMNLALIRTPGNKPDNDATTKITYIQYIPFIHRISYLVIEKRGK